MNPLNNGIAASQTAAIPAIPPQILDTIKQIAGMIQSGTDLYTITKALKTRNITPDAVERGLYLVMPELREVKQRMTQMGIDPKAFIGQIMKENNISQDELKNMIGDLAKKFTRRWYSVALRRLCAIE